MYGHKLILADFWHLDDPFTAGGQSAEHHNHAVAAKVAVAGRPEHIPLVVESMREHIWDQVDDVRHLRVVAPYDQVRGVLVLPDELRPALLCNSDPWSGQPDQQLLNLRNVRNHQIQSHKQSFGNE